MRRWRRVLPLLVAAVLVLLNGTPDAWAQATSMDQRQRDDVRRIEAKNEVARRAHQLLASTRQQLLDGSGRVRGHEAGKTQTDVAAIRLERTTGSAPSGEVSAQSSFFCPGSLSGYRFEHFSLAEILHYCPVPMEFYISEFVWYDQFTGEILQISGSTDILSPPDFIGRAIDGLFGDVGVPGYRGLIACGQPVIAGYISTAGCGQLFYL